MAMTGAERVRRHRQKQLEEIADLKKKLYKAQADHAHAVHASVEIIEENENLRRANKRVGTMYRNSQSLLRAWQEGDEEEVAVLTEEMLENLRAMTPQELVNWVKIAKTMNDKEHDSPVTNAIRWIEGNRPRETA